MKQRTGMTRPLIVSLIPLTCAMSDSVAANLSAPPVIAGHGSLSADGTPTVITAGMQADGPPVTANQTAPHLTPDATLGDLLDNPAFAGFASRLLPWDGRNYDRGMKLSQMGSLLPWHSAVDTAAMTSALNRMIDDSNAGLQVFHDIYSTAEKRADPAKSNTGLFFYRGQPGAPFALIAPGGGFVYVGSVHEGFPYAREISSAGYNAFVLKYRTGLGGHAATLDMAAALGFILRHAADLGVSQQDYSLWGSSAGARMAASIGSHGPVRFGGDDAAPPAAVIMAYTAHADTGTSEPPAFVIVGEHDGISPPASMEQRAAVLRRMGTEVEYHLIPAAGHGFGPGIGTKAEGWLEDAIDFWKRQISIRFDRSAPN